jgi:hypothetical protein
MWTLRITFVSLLFVGFFTGTATAQSDIYKRELAERFPAAKQVEWEFDDGYMTAEFRDEFNQEVEVKYNSEANWVMTKIDMYFRNLPENIRKAFQGSAYAQWRVDDIDYIEKAGDEPVYVLEVEKGEQEHKLIITAKGVLLNK